MIKHTSIFAGFTWDVISVLSGSMAHVSVSESKIKTLSILLSVIHVKNIRNRVMRNYTASVTSLMMTHSKYCPL